MKSREPYQLPAAQQEKIKRAEKLALWSLFFLLTITVVIFLTMGTSQAMRTAWVEDIWSMIPPIVFLVAMRIQRRKPNQRYPYGFYSIGSIAFLSAATAVFLLGLFMTFDAGRSLYRMEHPTIGAVELLGYRFWSGWLMIAALVYSAIPPVILGHLKASLGKELHAKTLLADAAMNKADWSTAVAAIIGILGVGLGFWWADAVAAGLIALDITRDGYNNLRQALTDLLDQRPTRVDSGEPDPLVEALAVALTEPAWVKQLDVRMREAGLLIAGEIFVVPEPGTTCLLQKLEDLRARALHYHWRIYDVVVSAGPPASLDTEEG